jgi:hypothetical protein
MGYASFQAFLPCDMRDARPEANGCNARNGS